MLVQRVNLSRRILQLRPVMVSCWPKLQKNPDMALDIKKLPLSSEIISMFKKLMYIILLGVKVAVVIAVVIYQSFSGYLFYPASLV